MPVALLSVSNKTGLVTFASGLKDLGWELMASGGTAAALRKAGIEVIEIATYTGSPEILGGRVKTIHPAVAGGILAQATPGDQADLEKIGARYIDLVVCNLYPFENTVADPGVSLEKAVENIDIGGVTLLRAAAKNFSRVAVVVYPEDYAPVLEELKQNQARKQGGLSLSTRRLLAEKAFAHTAAYDAAISNYLSAGQPRHQLELFPVQVLRYGENWHQEATLYGYEPGAGPMGGHVLQGKAVSYNNMLDLDAAWRCAVAYEQPAVCIVKHLSPCGVAIGESLADAFPLALASDPVSAFGGVIAVNRLFDEAIAVQLGDLFVECIVAPGFSPGALDLLAHRKNLRLLSMPDTQVSPPVEYRSIVRGMLAQSIDLGDPPGIEWKVVTQRAPTPDEYQALRFAWVACQHVKSNAIVFATKNATVGIGGGQPNRIDCVGIAASRAGERSRGAVMASDAFFPFPDVVEAAARAGITAIVQPGGSIRDDLSIQACDQHGIAMVFTGVRHFRH